MTNIYEESLPLFGKEPEAFDGLSVNPGWIQFYSDFFESLKQDPKYQDGYYPRTFAWMQSRFQGKIFVMLVRDLAENVFVNIIHNRDYMIQEQESA